MEQKEYIESYLKDASEIISKLDRQQILNASAKIKEIRSRNGRLFILGVGGSAANASHAVNDFRKIAEIEAYAPLDNVSELTARTNDDGWHSVFVNWLKVSKLTSKDGILVFSVGGGDVEKNISANLVHAIDHAKKVGATVIGVVGWKGGHTKNVADACVVVPLVNKDTVTPHTESFQEVIWHLIVSSPDLKTNEMKWESIK